MVAKEIACLVSTRTNASGIRIQQSGLSIALQDKKRKTRFEARVTLIPADPDKLVKPTGGVTENSIITHSTQALTK